MTEIQESANPVAVAEDPPLSTTAPSFDIPSNKYSDIFGLWPPELFAKIMAARDRAGRPMLPDDAWIAATAMHHDLPLATHDANFLSTEGLRVISANPEVLALQSLPYAGGPLDMEAQCRCGYCPLERQHRIVRPHGRRAIRAAAAAVYWKSAASAVAMLFLPCFFERWSATVQALMSASSASSRGGTRLATPALTVR